MDRHPDQRFCGECGKLISRAADFCTGCGARQTGGALVATPPAGGRLPTDAGAVPRIADEKFCLRCGRVVHESAAVCPGCGAVQGNSVTGTTSGRNRTTAALLALLLGGLGAHRFYIGRTGSGILYLVFFWTLIPAFIGLIEGVIWLTMDDARWQAQYGGEGGF